MADSNNKKKCGRIGVSMINDNIKIYRKKKGLSQEEMAVKLNVVRQTVSKWENGRSVPDAEMLIKIAELFEVPVSKLLGIETEPDDISDMTEKLASLNEELARKNQREKLLKSANEKRGLILLLSFVSVLLDVSVNNTIFSIVSSGTCILIAIIILYRNLALMTSVTTDNLKLKYLRITTIFNIIIVITCIVLAVLTTYDIITFRESGEKTFDMFIISAIIVFAGIISPKLPFTRHTGLRLPWTVQDEDTWNVAHRIIGYISLPIVLLYIGCSLTIDNFKAITLTTMFLWIGIPSVISGIYYWKRMNTRI